MKNNKSDRLKLMITVFLVFCLILPFGLAGCGSPQTEKALDTAEEAVEEAADTTVEKSTSGQSSEKKIGKKEALKIALKDADFSEADVKVVSVNSDIDDGREIYEVEFKNGKTEYNYDIDAYSGKILDKDVDRDDDDDDDDDDDYDD